MKKYYQIGLVLILGAFTTMMFQNCGQGFEGAGQESAEDDDLNSFLLEEENVIGAAATVSTDITVLPNVNRVTFYPDYLVVRAYKGQLANGNRPPKITFFMNGVYKGMLNNTSGRRYINARFDLSRFTPGSSVSFGVSSVDNEGNYSLRGGEKTYVIPGTAPAPASPPAAAGPLKNWTSTQYTNTAWNGVYRRLTDIQSCKVLSSKLNNVKIHNGNFKILNENYFGATCP